MNTTFEFDGVTYEARPLTVGDQLDIDWLNQQFAQADREMPVRQFARVMNYTSILIGIKVTSGEPPAFMKSPDAPIDELQEGLAAWLKAPKRLMGLAQKAMDDVDSAGNPSELTNKRPNG